MVCEIRKGKEDIAGLHRVAVCCRDERVPGQITVMR